MLPEFSGPGYKKRVTPSGHLHIEMDYWAVPSRDVAWATKMKRTMGERKFNREFRRDWESSAGDPYYPEWNAVEKPYRIVPAPGILKTQPMLRFFDFGFRYPGCLWAQYDPRMNRLWVMREWMPQNIDAHSFADVVAYLSGEIDKDQFNLEAPPLARRWLARLEEEDSKYPPVPWFKQSAIPLRWENYAGPEATQVKNSVQSEAAERTWSEVFQSKGMPLSIRYTRHKARSVVLRSLMRPRSDNYYGLIVDPACSILLAGLNGGIAYDEPSKDNPNPDDCVKDGYYEHLHDALGYGATQVVMVVDEKPRRAHNVPSGVGGRTLRRVYEDEAQESLGFHEVEDGQW